MKHRFVDAVVWIDEVDFSKYVVSVDVEPQILEAEYPECPVEPDPEDMGGDGN